MRIVAGKYRGRRLAPPRGRDVRPTADRVREAVFSILGGVDGCSVLDLFAGTGAMGLEALSRGAAKATFVEIDRRACDIVRRNIDAIVSADGVTTHLVKGDSVRVVQTLAMAGDRFDLVLLDPPYEQAPVLLERLAHTLPSVCSEGTRVVVEVSVRHQALPARLAELWNAETLTSKVYGDTAVAVLRMPAVGSLPDSMVPADPDDGGDEADTPGASDTAG